MQVDIPVCSAARPGQSVQPAAAPVSHQCRVLPQGEPYLQMAASVVLSVVWTEKKEGGEGVQTNGKNERKRNQRGVVLLPICTYMLTMPV